MAGEARPRPPRPRFALAVAVSASLVVAVSYWLATRPGAESAQDGVVTWLNQPPGPLAALLDVVNPLLRPWPLVVVGGVLLGWLLVGQRSGRERLEVARAGVVAFVVADLIARVLKHLATEPRPLTVLAGLDTHGYPREPSGHAFPSAHTAVVVGIVAAVWPWMRPGQRVAGALLAVLVGLHRVYIGAHWPIDVVGGAAVGMLAASIAWLAATRWPIGVGEPR